MCLRGPKLFFFAQFLLYSPQLSSFGFDGVGGTGWITTKKKNETEAKLLTGSAPGRPVKNEKKKTEAKLLTGSALGRPVKKKQKLNY